MKKWLHRFVDRSVVRISSRSLGKNQYFQQSIDSVSFRDHLYGVSAKMPPLTGKGLYEVSGETRAGELETNVVVKLWKGPEFPTFVYQHGNVERPYDFFPLRENLIERIFYPDPLQIPDYNLILIRSFIDGDTRNHFHQMRHLNTFMAKLSFYCVLQEKIIQFLRPPMPRRKRKKETPPGIILGGTGFAGTVVNLHRTYFNTADAYVPLLAGADPGHVFTKTIYSKMMGRLARNNRNRLDTLLNFEYEFLRVTDRNLYPLLGLYDQIVLYEHQRRGYDGHPVQTIPRGHFTGLTDARAIRKQLMTALSAIQDSKESRDANRWG